MVAMMKKKAFRELDGVTLEDGFGALKKSRAKFWRNWTRSG